MSDDTLVITGLRFGDVVFENEVGVWNVSRIAEDAQAGLFGEIREVSVRACLEATKATIRDRAKVALFRMSPGILAMPVLVVMEDAKGWLVDGNHRMQALGDLGREDAPCYIVPEDMGPRYHVLFNGHRTLDKANAAR